MITTGSQKAVALQKVVEGGISPVWIANCLQLHENATVACDEAATNEIQVKTVKYFKSIEKIEHE